MKIYHNLSTSIEKARSALINTGYELQSESWQAQYVKDKPEMVMWETLFFSFMAPIPATIAELQDEVKPNLPWADVHFEERVSGKPLNPGESYKSWPFYKMDKEMRTEGEQFSHTYMERYWPKKTSKSAFGFYDDINSGIRYDYGDLLDVVRLLEKEPNTRQAYLPVWFPEDTGNVMNKRVPCSLGYQFIRRKGKLHVEYHIRSCDFRRHFRDDIYLTCRLVQWIINELNFRSGPDITMWRTITPGYLKMNITSLHCFKQELKHI